MDNDAKTPKTSRSTTQSDPSQQHEQKSSHSEDYIVDPYYYASKEKCARCKQQGVFICEHSTSVRDNLKNVYAEEGRFYLAPKKSTSKSEYSSGSTHNSSINSAASKSNDTTKLVNTSSNGTASKDSNKVTPKNRQSHTESLNGDLNGKLANTRTNNDKLGQNGRTKLNGATNTTKDSNNNQKDLQNNKLQEATKGKKDSGGCCIIS